MYYLETLVFPNAVIEDVSEDAGMDDRDIQGWTWSIEDKEEWTLLLRHLCMLALK